MRVRMLLLLVTVFFMALVIGCAKAPQQEIDAAKAALDAAKTGEADRYAADEFNAAQDSLDAAMAEIDQQNAKFALTRNYGKAAQLLKSATDAANAAAVAVAANKEQVKTEATDLVGQAQTAVSDAKALLAKAPKGKEGKAALEAIQADLSAVETSLGEASTALTNGDFLTARDKAKAALDKANSLKDELQQAISKKTMLSR
ncbi:MAG TPA: DUF4398 domain-containing protein [bacterium]